MNLLEQTKEIESANFKVISGGAAMLPQQSEEMEIDLVDLSLVLLDKIQYIIFFLLLGAILLNAYSYFFMAPTYESTAKMYIVSTSGDSMVDLTDLNIGTSLTADYEELIMSYPVLDQVIERMELDINYTDLAKMISIRNPSNTRILSINVVSKDPALSRDIANTVVAVAIDYLPKTMGTAEPNIAQEARAALRKSSPSYSRYTMIGAFLGVVLYCAYVVLRYILDDTVHTSDDLEKYFGIVPLTSIPDIDAIHENQERKKKKNARRKK